MREKIKLLNQKFKLKEETGIVTCRCAGDQVSSKWFIFQDHQALSLSVPKHLTLQEPQPRKQ